MSLRGLRDLPKVKDRTSKSSSALQIHFLPSHSVPVDEELVLSLLGVLDFLHSRSSRL